MLARRTSIDVLYNGVNITKDVSGHITSFSYTDNADGNADDINLTLRDSSGHWMNDWKIERGDRLEAVVNVTNWKHEGDNRSLRCGVFNIDSPQYSGPPRSISLKAISTPIDGNFTTPSNKMWKKIGLDKIAAEIAKKHNYKLTFDSNRPRYYNEIEQKDRSDLEFLNGLCSNTAHNFKVADGQIIIYDEALYESRPVITSLRPDQISSYSFEPGAGILYDSVEVSYQEGSNGKIITGTFNRPGGKGIKIEKITNEKVSDQKDAEYMARAALRNLNKKTATASITMIGYVDICAGSCIYLASFGFHSGKYFVDSANHSINNDYNLSLKLHKCLEGY